MEISEKANAQKCDIQEYAFSLLWEVREGSPISVPANEQFGSIRSKALHLLKIYDRVDHPRSQVDSEAHRLVGEYLYQYNKDLEVKLGMSELIQEVNWLDHLSVEDQKKYDYEERKQQLLLLQKKAAKYREAQVILETIVSTHPEKLKSINHHKIPQILAELGIH
jgi:hypothetical protein